MLLKPRFNIRNGTPERKAAAAVVEQMARYIPQPLWPSLEKTLLAAGDSRIADLWHELTTDPQTRR